MKEVADIRGNLNHLIIKQSKIAMKTFAEVNLVIGSILMHSAVQKRLFCEMSSSVA